MHRICTTVQARGAHVTLIGRLRSQSKQLGQFPFDTKRINCFFEKGKLFYLEFNLRLMLYILVKRFDIICAIDLDTLLPATVAAKLRRKKLGYDAHEFFTEVPEVVHRKAIKAAWNAVAKFCIPKTDFRYTVGAKLAVKFEEAYGAPFQVVRNVPVYTAQINEAQDSSFDLDEPFILYQGALNVGRGLECLIKAARSLNLSVVIAGEGDLSDELRTMVKEEALENKVRFMGFVEPEELKELTHRAFLGYNLLENLGLSYYYSLANKFFDYTMAGVPCLNSPFPEYNALNEKYNLSVSCNLNEKDIIEAINELVKNENRYNQLKANCIKAREILNWDKEAMTLASIYERQVQ